MKEEKIFTSKIIIFLVVFAAVAIGITSAFIYSENNKDIAYSNNIENEVLENAPTLDYSLGLKDLNGKYKTNNVQTEAIEYSEGEEFYISTYYSIFPLKIHYIKIDGLKNETIEEKINEMIKEYAFELSEKYTAESIEIYCGVSGNFSNILSLSFDVNTRRKITENDWEHDYIAHSLNIDLSTGNKITLEECFVDGASIKSIISESAYTDLAWDEKYIWGTWDEENEVMLPADKSDLEDRVFRILYEIQKGFLRYITYKYNNIYKN